MHQFAVISSESSAGIEVRARLSGLGLEEVDDASTADILVVAVGRMEGREQLRYVQASKQREHQGLVAIFSSRCVSDDWRVLLPYVPTLIASSASPAELTARLEDAGEATRRLELARTGKRRLSLLRESIEEMSMIDMRTGMYSRRFLLTRLREALSAARRYGRPLTLCVFRIEGYDSVVREHGDEKVGLVIDALSDKLAVSLRTADVQAWIARDEFAMLLPETPPDGAKKVADRIVEEAAKMAKEHGLEGPLTSCYDSPQEDETSPESFLERVRSLLPDPSSRR